MKKKGFTLVELLAVLVILGILLTLAISGVSRYINKGKKSYYVGLEKNVRVAAQDYFADYKGLLPRKVGDITSVNLELLMNNNYIDDVLDENKKLCDGAVTVVKTEQSEYEYSVCLKCNDKYNSDEESCIDVDENNVAKTYEIVLNGEVNQTINQCDEINIPTATVKQIENVSGSETIITDKLESLPKTIDTTILGESTLKWVYHYKSLNKTVRVVDTVKPELVSLKLAYLNGNEYKSKNNSGNAIITNQNLMLNVESTDYACKEKYPKLEGSGLAKILYKSNMDNQFREISTSTNKVKSELSDTLFGDVVFKVQDKYGNESNIISTSVYMDKVAPSATAINYIGGANTHKFKNDYKIALIATDDIDVASFDVDYNNDGIFDQKIYANTSGAFIFVPTNGFSSCNVRFRAEDIAGNKGPWTSTQHIHMDTENPSATSVNLNGYTKGVWTNRNINISLSSLDNIGIDHYEYRINQNSDVTSINNSLLINTDQDNLYYFRSLDEAGNASDWTSEISIKRDTVYPSLTIGNPTTSTKSIIVPILENTDDRSGINDTTCVYGTTNAYGVNGTVINNQCIMSGKDDTTYYYKVTTKDKAGNITEKVGSTKTEKFGNVTISANKSSWDTARYITFNGATNGSTLQYKMVVMSDQTKNVDWTNIDDNTSITLKNMMATLSSPIYIYARLNDGVNTSDEIVYVETKLDISQPILNLTSATATTNNIVISFTADDTETSIVDYKCEYGLDENYGNLGTINANSCVLPNLNVNTKYYYNLEVTNEAGLVSRITESVSSANFGNIVITPNNQDWATSRSLKIDGTAPGATLQYKVVVMSDQTKNVGWTNITSGSSITLNSLATTDLPTYVYARLVDGINTSDEITYTDVKIDPTIYSITYNLNGGTGSTKNTFNAGETFTLITPTKAGYTFTGWTGSNGTSANKTVTIPNGTRNDLSYTANWSVKNYTVTIEANNATVDNSSINVNYGGTGTVSITPNTGYYLSSVSCTNGYTASATLNNINNQTVTINNNNKDATSECTLTMTRLTASNLSYSNANTGLDCTDVQCALDKIAEMLK